VSVLLNIALVAALLGFSASRPPAFAALLAAGGVAIGVDRGDLLANFAAGAFASRNAAAKAAATDP
jgi:small-conductance mechanosensitive channel